MNNTVRTSAVVAGVLIVAAVGWLLLRPAPQLSDRGYEVSMALLRACNQRDSAAIEDIEATVSSFAAEGQLDASDVETFQRVLALAEDDKWQDASDAIRSVMLQQAKPTALPDLGD
ncbi:MAG: hypothetical protein Aurels2KO_11730 [Aureliella sp.]